MAIGRSNSTFAAAAAAATTTADVVTAPLAQQALASTLKPKHMPIIQTILQLHRARFQMQHNFCVLDAVLASLKTSSISMYHCYRTPRVLCQLLKLSTSTRL